MGNCLVSFWPDHVDYKKADYNTNRKLINIYASENKSNYEKAADIYFWIGCKQLLYLNNKNYDSFNILEQAEYWRIGKYYYNKMKNTDDRKYYELNDVTGESFIDEINNKKINVTDFDLSVIRAKYFLSRIVINSIESDDAEIDLSELHIMLTDLEKYDA